MRIAVTGANGLFGRGLIQVLRASHDVVPLYRADADITDRDQVGVALYRAQPEVVIHAAANPDPDDCQLHPEAARRVNVGGTANVVSAAKEVGCAVALISTDAVFGGTQASPYTETDQPNPISVYGQTKLDSERELQALDHHWIFRVSVLFGPGKLNFVSKGLHKIARGENYTVARDQVGSATYTLDAAQVIGQVISSAKYGCYHLSNQGQCSRLELARKSAEMAGLDPQKVIGIPIDAMNRPGPRPKHTVLKLSALTAGGFQRPRRWEDALAEYLRLELPALDRSV